MNEKEMEQTSPAELKEDLPIPVLKTETGNNQNNSEKNEDSKEKLNIKELDESYKIATPKVEGEVHLLNEQEQHLLESLKPDWLLWEIGALKQSERKEFSEIVNYLKRNKTFTIPTKKLLEKNIHPSRSSLLLKLARSKTATITREALSLNYRIINKENLPKTLKGIEKTFTEMMKENRKDLIHYPTSHFKIIDRSCINTIPLEKIGWKNLNNPQYNDKLLEITFPEYRYPPLLITAEDYQYLQKVATDKIIYHMMHLAGEDSEFFAERIEVDKKRLSVQYPRLFEFDLARLNKGSSRGYREEYTKIVLEKIFNNSTLSKTFLVEFDSNSNSHTLKYFAPSSPKSFDFLQSFDFLKEITLHSDINNAVQIHELNKLVFESIKLYLSLDDIKTYVYKDFPDLAESQFNSILARFHDEYVNKKNRNDIPQIFNFKMVLEEGEEEQSVYIHYLVLNRLINTGLERFQKNLANQIITDWETKIANHKLTGAMFSNHLFSQNLLRKFSNEENFVYQLIQKPNIYRILENLDQLSRFTLRLKLYTHSELDKVFSLNREKLYKKAYDNVFNEKSFFAKIIFILINWIYKRGFDPEAINLEEEEKNPIIKEISNGKENKVAYLQAIGIESEDSLSQQCDNIWANLPESLNQKELEQNIRSDLSSFFSQRKEVPLFALDYIIENNVKRILKKGQHLTAYRKNLEEYTRVQTYLIIYKNSHLRKKVNLIAKQE